MRPSKKEQLLKAAATIVRRDGADALTLDAVAAEASVSKGGLLYHFDSKEALVAAMVELLVEGFDAVLPPQGGGSAGEFSRSYLAATADTDEASLSLSAGLLAAVAIAPETLEPLRARYRTWNKRLRDDGIDEVDALINQFATAGKFGVGAPFLFVTEPAAMAIARADVEERTDRVSFHEFFGFQEAGMKTVIKTHFNYSALLFCRLGY